jgi:ABC-type branched-subunit amino acid transport system ATPase component
MDCFVAKATRRDDVPDASGACAVRQCLLLLDQPFEGLAPTVILTLFKVFDALSHTSILIVEHNFRAGGGAV